MVVSPLALFTAHVPSGRAFFCVRRQRRDSECKREMEPSPSRGGNLSHAIRGGVDDALTAPSSNLGIASRRASTGVVGYVEYPKIDSD